MLVVLLYYVKSREKKVVFATFSKVTQPPLLLLSRVGLICYTISMKRPRIPFGAERFLSIFEGIEGGFAIGAGVLAGLSFVSLDRDVLLATALVSIIVNGYNSASVKYSSEHYIDELDGREVPHRFRTYVGPALINFISYCIVSIISIAPLLFIREMSAAVIWSVVSTIVVLFIGGFYRASLLDMPRVRDALETVTLGIGIIAVGFISGWIVHIVIGA